MYSVFVIANGSHYGAVDIPPLGDPLGDHPNPSGGGGVANNIVMTTLHTRSGSSGYFFKKSKVSF